MNAVSTGIPGQLSLGTWACAVCGAAPNSLADIRVRKMPPAHRRRGKSLSKKSQFNATHRFACRTCRQRMRRPAIGPSFMVQQVEWRVEDFFDTVSR